MRFSLKQGLTAGLNMMFAGAVSAQTTGVVLQNGAEVQATAAAGYGYEQNIALTSQNEIDSGFVDVIFRTSLVLDPGNFVHTLSFDTDSRWYQNSNPDNYTDYKLEYKGVFEANSRNRTKWFLSVMDDHQQRGTGLDKYFVQSVAEAIEFRNQKARVEHEYGGLTAIGRVGAAIEYFDREFLNLDEFTQFNNFDAVTTDGWFYYNVGAATSLSIDASFTANHYDRLDNSISRDSDVIRVLVGGIWSGLAKTSGRFKVGYEDREFEDNRRQNFSGLTLDIGATWSPKTYSTFNLDIIRRTAEAGILADLRVINTLDLSWEHAWSDVTSSSLSYQFIREEEKGGLQREDDRQYAYIGLSRKLGRHISANLNVVILTNNSTDAIFDFDNQQINATVSYIL